VYLQQQWEMLPSQTRYPIILEASKKYHYGKLYPEVYTLWIRLKEQMGVEFDFVHDPVGWSVLLEHIERLEGTPIYIHQGGLLGNVSMLKRYQYKYRHLAKLILQDEKAPKVRGHSAKENPVLT